MQQAMASRRLESEPIVASIERDASASPGHSLPGPGERGVLPRIKSEPVIHEDQNPFANVLGIEDGPSDEPQQTSHLPQLLADANSSVDALQDAMITGVRIIDNLIEPLEAHTTNRHTLTNHDALAFVKSLKELRDKAIPTRTVVGVVGNTGSGKSSVINALLDEER